jgi:hypothetical protein
LEVKDEFKLERREVDIVFDGVVERLEREING